MKSFTASIAAAVLALTIGGLARGQNRERNHSDRGVTVERADWYKEPWSPCWYVIPNSEINNLCNGPYGLRSDSIRPWYCQPPSKPSMNGVDREFVYRVILRNDSENTIRTVEWDYIFIDPMTQAEVGRHHFYSEKKVRAHHLDTVVEYSSSPPTKVIGIKALLQPEKNIFIEEVVIRRVTYEDGSIWENRSSLSDRRAG